MYYKIGDRIKIKTWEQLVEEYGLTQPNMFSSYNSKPYILTNREYIEKIEKELKELETNRFLTVTWLYPHDAKMEYGVKEFSFIIDELWVDNKLSRIAPAMKVSEKNRFELMDLDNE